MTSFLAQVLYSVWTAWTLMPVPPLLPSEVSEILLTLCDHRPIHDPAPCCSSVTEQRGPRCRASSSRTHTRDQTVVTRKFFHSGLAESLILKKKKKKNQKNKQHADTPPSSLTLISGTTVAHFLDPALWFPPSFLHITNCSTLDLNSFLPSSS